MSQNMEQEFRRSCCQGSSSNTNAGRETPGNSGSAIMKADGKPSGEACGPRPSNPHQYDNHDSASRHHRRPGQSLAPAADEPRPPLHERPEALDKACFIIAGIDENSLLQAVDTAVSLNRDGFHGIPVPDYVDENVSTKVVKIIQSYTGIVNKMVWRKF